MIYIKMIGVILIMLGTTYYGFYLSYKQTNRIKRLKSFRSTISIVEGQIRFAYMSIPEAFSNIAKKTQDPVLADFYDDVSNVLKEKECEDFSEAWDQGIQTYIKDTYLPDTDCDALRVVGTMPVYLDGNMQIKILEEALTELDSIISEAELHIKEKCKIYKCTGFVAGIFIVLILI